jgi:hypothetical protein
MLENMIQTFVPTMIQVLFPTIWACFAVYAIWYATSAKRYVPITRTEAKALWHIHKQNVQCGGKKCKEIKSGGKIIGFECACGYKHFQKRPIVGSTPAGNIKVESPECSAFDTLYASYKSK